jgi:hypothetical protein
MIKIDEKGFYGKFGGAYIPEMLHPNIEELRENYESIMASPGIPERNSEACSKTLSEDQLLCILPPGSPKNMVLKSTSSGKTFAIPAHTKSITQ